MVDASRGFMKDGNKNRLRSQDIHKIVDVFNRQTKLPRYSRLVSFEEIAKNDYNLNIPRYIDASEPEDLHDLSAHLNGGIPEADIVALDAYWRVFPSLQRSLFGSSKRQGYSQSLVPASQVKATILNHQEFELFAAQTLAHYTAWYQTHEGQLKGIAIGDKPKALIKDLSEDLLAQFAEAPLLDKYNIYQIPMDYWAETMQDDVYVLAQDGWSACKVLEKLLKGENALDALTLTIGKQKYRTELIPPALIVARYFSDKQVHLEALQSDLDSVSQELEALIEEHSVDEGLLSDAQTDTGKVTKSTVSARLKETKRDLEASEEQPMLTACLKLFEREATQKKAIKDSQDALDRTVFAQYSKLTEDEIKSLVVEDKWHATLKADIIAEIERVTQQLANRVKVLEERYAEPLPQLVQEVEMLSSKVDEHLKQMGLGWN